MSTTTITHPISLGSEQFATRPQEHYRWLRENAPVYRGRMAALVEQDVWLISRYEDCRSLLTDDRFPRSPEGGPSMASELSESLQLITTDSLLYADDPRHRRLRKLVTKPFTPKMIETYGARVGELAHGLLDELIPRGQVDLRQEFALPIPITVISEMVGVGPEDRAQFQHGVEAIIGGLTEIDQAEWNRQADAVVAFVRELIEQHRKAPADDILTGLIEAEEDGESLSENELVAMVFTLVTAGYETTYNLITNACATLLEHPDQMQTLRSTPTEDPLWRSAVDELVRYSGPVSGTEALTAAEEVTWHGETIPAGAMVFPLLGAANRDPEAFSDPDTFDIARSPNHHMGFGNGVHFCLGANLARMETRVALHELLQRCPRLALAVDRAELAVRTVPLFSGYRELPVTLS